MKRFKVTKDGDVYDNASGNLVTSSEYVVEDNGECDLFSQYKDVTNLRYIANQLDMSVPDVKKLLKR